MKLAYFDCRCGISGDMTLGALVDAGVSLDKLNAAVESLGLPDCRLVAQEVKKNGFRATQVTVEVPPEQGHRHLSDILRMIHRSRLTNGQKELAGRIFRRLADAEAQVHGIPVDKVHFHEVGAADSIADVVGSAVGWDLLGADRLVVSPIPTGTGTVKIDHGRCSVPAPATAELLKGIPLAESSVPHELTTPTGAAIVATLADAFGPLPAMTLERIGYGAGKRDLDQQANLVRLFVGEAPHARGGETVWVVETNLDDVTGELIGYCTARLRDLGVLDVYTTAIQMKKGRPAVKLSVLCEEPQVGAVEAVVFAETSTLGVRRWPVRRHVLPRRPHQVQTPWGPVEGKIGWLDDGSPRFAPEFESCRQIATRHGVPLQEVFEAARRAFLPEE